MDPSDNTHTDRQASEDAAAAADLMLPLPLPERGRGRPKQGTAPFYFEPHHKQQKILELIQKASKKNASELERAFHVGSPSSGNAGKAWRSWASGRVLYGNLGSIVQKAEKKGWLPDKARELFAYFDDKLNTHMDHSRREERFLKAQHALFGVLEELREICEEEYEHHHAQGLGAVPPLSIRCGEDEESFTSHLLNWSEVEDMIQKLDEAVHLLGRLDMNLVSALRTDPQLGVPVYFGDKYKARPGEKLPPKPWDEQD